LMCTSATVDVHLFHGWRAPVPQMMCTCTTVAVHLCHIWCALVPQLMCTCAPREGLGEGMDVLLHSFLMSKIERNEWTVSRPDQFTPTEKALTYTWQKKLNFTLIRWRPSSFWIVRQSTLVVVYRRFGIAYGPIEGPNRFLGLEPLNGAKKTKTSSVPLWNPESSLDNCNYNCNCNCNFPGFLIVSVVYKSRSKFIEIQKPIRESVLC
jgi:hypothetical protein